MQVSPHLLKLNVPATAAVMDGGLYPANYFRSSCDVLWCSLL